MMMRRDFITLLGGAVAGWPVVARAQQPALPVLGYLCGQSPVEFAHFLDAFRQGLNETGHIEHRNVGIEYRWAQGQFDRLPAFAADLVRLQVSVIVATGTVASALAAKVATATIPIVFNTGTDPVKLGLVSSFNRPGGNITGVSSLNSALGSKRLQLLHELVPAANAIGLLVGPSPTLQSETLDVQAAARVLGLNLHVETVSSESAIDAAFASFAEQQVHALLVQADAFLIAQRDRLVALANQHAWPTCYGSREHVAVGGLMSYSPNLIDAHRQLGIYTGRILKGEKPADLPVIQPTKFQLVINLKTAKALGLTISNSIQLLADEVIE